MKYVLASYGTYLYAINSPKMSGGNDKQRWLLAKALAAHGNEVVLIVPAATPLESENIAGVRVVRCSESFPALLHVILALWKEKPDWVHHMGATTSLWALALAAHLFGIRVSYALAIDADCQPRTAVLQTKSLWRLYGLGMQIVDLILAQHPRQIDLLAPNLRKKAFPMNNIVETYPIEDKGHEPYFSWVGWIGSRKRPHLVVEVAKALPQVRFVVCGTVISSEAELVYGRNLIEVFKTLPNIDYKGFISPQETQRVIAESTALISTSEMEGMPNTFLEAWASGVPTISLELDPGNVITTYQAGEVVPSLERLIECINGFLREPEKAQSLGVNGYQYVHQFHSSDFARQQYEFALGVPKSRNTHAKNDSEAIN